MKNPGQKMVQDMVRKAGKAAPKVTKGGGTHTGVIGASAPSKIPGGASGVTRSGVKPMTKTSARTFPAWEAFLDLRAAGLVSEADFQKVASAREQILALPAQLEESGGKLDKQAGVLTGVRKLIGRALGGRATVGGQAFAKSERKQLLRALQAVSGGNKVDETFIKKGPWDEVVKHVKATQPRRWPGPLGKAGLLVAAGAAAGTANAVDDLYDKAREKRDFGKMMESTQELRDHDEGQVRAAYAVLRGFAPSVASHPVAAGQLVNQLVNSSSLADIHSVESLAKTEGAISGRRKKSNPLIDAALAVAGS